MHVYTVVPVAPFEPESIITKSIECLKELEHEDFSLEVYYISTRFRVTRGSYIGSCQIILK